MDNTNEILEKAAENAERIQILSVTEIMMQALKPMSPKLLRDIHQNPQTHKDLGKDI